MGSSKKYLEVHGARVNNLKNIDVSIPRNEFTVITGLSGSGKSSLAFDTIFAEGQRRYIETFSSYARYFIGNLERPDVDNISGLSPVIAIEQKTVNKNPRSTVGTTTEIYDFLRLLFARAGEAYSYLTGEKMVKYGEEQILSLVMEQYKGKRINILSPLVRNRKGHYKEIFENMRKKGYLYVRIDGEIREILPGMKLDRYKNHNIELVVDKLKVSDSDERRVKESLRTAMQRGEGLVMILDVDNGELRHYSRMLMDPQTGLSYSEPAPHNFSFNSPNGACPKCKGLGYVNIIDREKIMPDMSLSIYQGGILPLGKYKNILVFWQIEAICDKYGVTLKTPLCDMPAEALDDILNGTSERLVIKDHVLGAASNYFTPYEGLVKYIEMQQQTDAPSQAQKWAGQFVSVKQCDDCRGMRLNREALSYKIGGKGIAELANMDIAHLYEWFQSLHEQLTEKQRSIAEEIIKEINVRLKFLIDVGLDYLNLNRASATLSGGESQRIRLATQIGSRLVNVLYILDEPSIGLHQKDNIKLITSLKQLRDVGNTIIVVEHDKEMMLAADYVIDLGPAAGRHGGNVVFSGTPARMLKADTLTAKYLNGEFKIPVPEKRRKGNGKTLVLYGARGNNLKGVDLMLPLGKFICITGVSGSGKSTLINSTLQPAISSAFYRSLRTPLPYDKIEGMENIDKLVTVDQSPLGRTPRSTPATYTGIFADIRALFTELPESKIRGYKSGRFSFNIAGGRCETCCGNGYRNIEMNFLPDVLVPCETCHGKRYNRETLEVRYKGKSIADILDMTINRAVEFFENVPSILNKIKVLQEVGLGYIKLGQPSTTLSGGESQRVKLATELSKRDTGNTLYLLDEPTTGLHFEDIRVLLNVLNRLADKGNTILVIEHNLDVIKTADYIIDMGPEGGDNGGRILCCGPPEEICAKYDTYTTRYLGKELYEH